MESKQIQLKLVLEHLTSSKNFEHTPSFGVCLGRGQTVQILHEQGCENKDKVEQNERRKERTRKEFGAKVDSRLR